MKGSIFQKNKRGRTSIWDLRVDAGQDSKYSLGSEHATVQNMSGLHKVLSKTLHYRYLIGL